MNFRTITRTSLALFGIANVSTASFMIATALGFFVLGFFCIAIAVGDRLSERRSLSDSRRPG